MLLAAVGVGVAGVVLLAAGLWLAGGLVLLAAVVVLASRALDVSLGFDRRRAGYALADLRGRAAATREAVAARSRAQLELFRARRELAELEGERGRLFHDLGAAVYGGDETGIKAARTAIGAVLERIAAKEDEIETLMRETNERIQRAQAPVQPTERMAAPDPARVPDPWPPPDEGGVPDPAPTPGPGDPTPGPDEPAPPKLER